MGKEPSEIREEIEQTRDQMGETVEALGYKADVKTRAKENIAGKRDRLKERITGTTSRVDEATPDAEQLKAGAKRAAGVAQENPIGLALGSLAVGFLAGMLVPSTRIEDEKIGPMADEVKDRAKETGQEALERGKEVAQDAARWAHLLRTRLDRSDRVMIVVGKVPAWHGAVLGAIVGHLALFEMTSSIPNRRYAEGLRRHGFAGSATEFFDEHVLADAVHENIAAVDLAGGLVRQRPELGSDVLWGARALVLLDARWASGVLEAWEAGESSLLDAQTSGLGEVVSARAAPV